MWTPPPLLLPSLLTFLLLPMPSLAQVGTASFYGPPYLPTVCYGSDEGQFPADNLFAAAGQGIWDNGASCGREYLVRCLSSATPNACAEGRTVQVVILDQAAALNSMPSRNGTTMVLSTTAFGMITKQSVDAINIEFTHILECGASMGKSQTGCCKDSHLMLTFILIGTLLLDMV